MSERPWPMGLALAGAVALAGGGCVIGDVFGSDGLEQVTLVYDGPSTLQIGAPPAAFSVTVQVSGAPVRNARVSVALSRDSVVEFTSGRDSVVGRCPGRVDLLARFESSMFVDTALTLTQEIHVQGGGQPPPGCPTP